MPSGDTFVDLHLHSTCSDGSFTPIEVVQRAAQLGFAGISLTDHDSVAGVLEAQAVGTIEGVYVVPGVELSAQVDEKDLHILGYFVDPDSPALQAYLKRFQDARLARAEKMVAKLNRLGVPVTMAHVMAKAGDAAVGRPHVADALVEEGFVFSANQAFNKYLGYAKPAYQPKFALTPAEAMSVIHAAGGLACLAHPGLYGADEYVPNLVDLGLDGLEVQHIRHDEGAVRHYKEMAAQYGLLMTGGSDCHGDGRGDAVMGRVKAPMAFLDAMRERCNR